MCRPARRIRRTPLGLAVVAALVTLVAAPGGPASAEPTPAPTIGAEGGSPLLRDVLEAAGREYVEAKAALAKSQKRQLTLTIELTKIEKRLAALTVEVNGIAAIAYRTGRIGPVSAMLNATSPDTFLIRAQAIGMMTAREQAKLAELGRARRDYREAKAAVDAEVANQQRQFAIMKKRKADAEKALALVGGKATGGFVNARSPVARAAPRAADGSWPSQSCSQPDPTTSGCLTPRTLHALREAQRLGFKRFVSCYRPGGPYEHPKGRACDFSAEYGGFHGTATGNNRLYGNNLAAFLVRNADRLGILYVIWYRQIWFPATGWRSYSGCCDAASSHTNHVHLSML